MNAITPITSTDPSDHDDYVYDISPPEFGTDDVKGGEVVFQLENLVANEKNEIVIKSSVEDKIRLMHESGFLGSEHLETDQIKYRFENGLTVLSTEELILEKI